MEWQIKTLARQSSLSETPFNAGDRIICLVFKDPQLGELGRADLLESELDCFNIPGEVLGRWVRIAKDPKHEVQSGKEAMASAEEFFFSLFDCEPSSSSEVADILKHLLALTLERKRILRAHPPRSSQGQQIYLHVKSKQELSVPIVEVTAELMMKIQDTLGELLLSA